MRESKRNRAVASSPAACGGAIADSAGLDADPIQVGLIGDREESEQFRVLIEDRELPLQPAQLETAQINRKRESEQQDSENGNVQIDCVVLIDPETVDWEQIDSIAVPTVLYTPDDPLELDEEILTAVDSIVEKQPSQSEQSRAMLVAKLMGVVHLDSARSSGEMLTEIVNDGQPVGIFLVEQSGTVTWSNRRFADIFPVPGADAEQSLYERLASLQTDNPSAMAETLALAGSDNGKPGRMLELSAGEGMQYYRHWSYPVDAGEVNRIELFQDVTDLKARQRDLERYETIVQAIGDPVCTFDNDWRFTYANEAFETITGYGSNDVAGNTPSMIMEESRAAEIRELTETLHDENTAGSATLEVELLCRDGSVCQTECHIAVLPSENDKSQGTVAVLRDISELKEREARLERFASVVSHDLRNPMDVAIGRAEVLPEVADVDEKTEKHLHEIFDSLKRMDQLIQDVLALTRTRDASIQLEELSLGAITTEAWGNVETADAQLSLEAGVQIMAHESRLLRLFENLFRNAIEHAGEDTTVEVGVLTAGESSTPVGFFVEDDGPGIPDNHRVRIFEDGFTTTDDGTGLGLAIVREIAHSHGWEIEIAESTTGARFEFRGITAAE